MTDTGSTGLFAHALVIALVSDSITMTGSSFSSMALLTSFPSPWLALPSILSVPLPPCASVCTKDGQIHGCKSTSTVREAGEE